MNCVIRSLAHVFRKHLLEEKWLIAPSLRAAHQWMDQVTKSGQPVVNVHAKTVRGMIFDLASPQMVRQRLRPLSDLGGIALVDRIMADLRQNARSGQSPSDRYFSLLPESISLSAGIHRSIKDVLLAGLDDKSLNLSAFEKMDKGREVSLILQEYRGQLRDLGLVDYRRAVDLALDELSKGLTPLNRGVLVLRPTNIDLTAKEREVFESLAEGTLIQLPFAGPVVGCCAVSEPSVDVASRTSQQEPSGATNKRTVTVFSALGEVNEVREVFRRCLANGIPFDQVEVLHTDADTYVPPIFEQAIRMGSSKGPQEGMIATFHEGIPALYSRPGKALAAWVSWNRDEFPQAVLLRMLEEDLIISRSAGDETLSALSLARVLRSANIGFKRDRYLPAFQKLIEAMENELSVAGESADDDDANAVRVNRPGLLKNLKHAQALLGIVSRLLGIAPAPGSPETTILERARSFVESFSRVANPIDDQSKRVIIAAIKDMEWLLERMGPISLNVWDWLSGLPRDLRVLGSGPKPGAIHVSSIHDGGHTGRQHTFIVGLDDGRFPGQGLQDPVLLDSERNLLSGKLPTASSQLSKKISKFSDLLEALPGTVTLSYSCRSIVDDSEMFPSPTLEDYLSGSGSQQTVGLQKSGSPVSFVPSDPDHALDMTEWWLARLCPTTNIADPEGLLARYFPHLLQGRKAVEQRRTSRFTIYDGLIPTPDPSLDPMSDSGPTISSSRLQTIGTCPRQYFFKYVLNIHVPEDTDIDKEIWLDSAAFGTLLHEVFYDFVSQRLQTGWPPEYPKDLPLIEKFVAKNIEETTKRIPPPSDEVFKRQSDELLRAARVFLQHESQTNDGVPVILEGSFGATSYDQGHRGSVVSTDAIRLPLPNGRGVRARAIMDRIDLIQTGDPNEYVIRDYKSGSTYRHRSEDHFWAGRSVQHGLYMDILQAAPSSVIPVPYRVKEFSYFFPGSREQGLPIVYPSSDLQEWGLVLQRLCETVAKGCFIATNEPRTDCKYCDYTPICGNVDHLAATIPPKMADQGNPQLEPFRELRNREQQRTKRRTRSKRA